MRSLDHLVRPRILDRQDFSARCLLRTGRAVNVLQRGHLGQDLGDDPPEALFGVMVVIGPELDAVHDLLTGRTVRADDRCQIDDGPPARMAFRPRPEKRPWPVDGEMRWFAAPRTRPPGRQD